MFSPKIFTFASVSDESDTSNQNSISSLRKEGNINQKYYAESPLASPANYAYNPKLAIKTDLSQNGLHLSPATIKHKLPYNESLNKMSNLRSQSPDLITSIHENRRDNTVYSRTNFPNSPKLNVNTRLIPVLNSSTKNSPTNNVVKQHVGRSTPLSKNPLNLSTPNIIPQSVQQKSPLSSVIPKPVLNTPNISPASKPITNTTTQNNNTSTSPIKTPVITNSPPKPTLNTTVTKPILNTSTTQNNKSTSPTKPSTNNISNSPPKPILNTIPPKPTLNTTISLPKPALNTTTATIQNKDKSSNTTSSPTIKNNSLKKEKTVNSNQREESPLKNRKSSKRKSKEIKK